MKTYKPEELQAILREHVAWLHARTSAARTPQRGLSSANLSSAKEMDSAIMPGGFTFAVYKSDLVPALLAAGGRDPKEVAARSWTCHKWANCPMAEAFSVHSMEDIPPLYREQARLFVQLFDAGLIPNPFEKHDDLNAS